MEVGDIIRNILTNHGDLVTSAAIGLVVAAGVISFNKTNPSGEITKVKEGHDNSPQNETEEPNSQSAESVEEMAEVISKTLKRKPHLRKFFGLGDENAAAPPVGESNDGSVEEMTEDISKTLERKPHLRKFFGLGDENATAPSAEALNDAHDTTQDGRASSGNVWIDTSDPEKEKIRDFVRKAQASEMEDEEIGAVLFRAGFGVIMVIGFIYSVNVMSKGEVARFLVGMFPVEAEALGLKDYFQRV